MSTIIGSTKQFAMPMNLATRFGLIPNKCEEDFGTDFLCLVEGEESATGSAPVQGGVLGFAVRTTSLDACAW